MPKVALTLTHKITFTIPDDDEAFTDAVKETLSNNGDDSDNIDDAIQDKDICHDAVLEMMSGDYEQFSADFIYPALSELSWDVEINPKEEG